MDDTLKRAWSRGPFRVELTCKLRFTGPLHVGTGEALSLATDAPVLRDPGGRVWLPGSSIRGVLADWCHREAPLLGVDRACVRRLFGVAPKQGDASSKNDRQGRLTVLDVMLEDGTEEIRDHVRIDRRWGAAALGGKFDHEIAYPAAAPAAQRRPPMLKLIYDGDSLDDPELVLLQSAADALQEELLAFGGKTGWGLGAARVRPAANGAGGLTWSVVDRAEPAELSTYLNAKLTGADTGRDGSPAAPNAGTDAHTKTVKQIVDLTTHTSCDRESLELPHANGPIDRSIAPWSWLRLRLRLAFDGPMLVGALDATVPPDETPTERREADAEADKSFTEERRKADATYQVDPQGRPVLAGSALRGPLRSDAERIQKTRGIDGLAETLFGTDDAQGLIRVEEGVLKGEERHVLLNHVSIDRVTGFAASARLFDVAALASPCFHSELLVRWHADDEKHRQAVALLFFVLRDAEQQGLWIGSRTTRGYGNAKQVTIEKARWSLVGPPNHNSSAGDTGPIRGPKTCATSIAVAELAELLGFVQQAWTSARRDASSQNVAEGAGSDAAD